MWFVIFICSAIGICIFVGLMAFVIDVVDKHPIRAFMRSVITLAERRASRSRRRHHLRDLSDRYNVIDIRDHSSAARFHRINRR